MVRYAGIFILAVLTCCTSGVKVIRLSVMSDPEGATVICSGEEHGKTPCRLRYGYSESAVDSGGGLLLPAMSCRWISGATDTIDSPHVNIKQGNLFEVNFTRPTDHPNLEADVLYGANSERSRQEDKRARTERRILQIEEERLNNERQDRILKSREEPK